MLKKSLTALIVSLGLALSLSVGAQEATAPSPATTNPFDPSAWMSGQQAGASFNWFDPASMGADISGQAPGMGIPQFNLANPGGWSVFMNPGTYAAMMNPATYGQFMTPQFYMQFMDPNNWMSWMNPAAYGPWMNPSTYMQSMNPMAYMQFMNPGTYMAPMNPANYGMFMNPGTYMQWMNPTAYTLPGTQPGVAGANTFNWFDPSVWTDMFGQVAPTPPAEAAATN